MLRTGQMILGAMLLRHLLGRDWRLTEQDQLAPYSVYRQVQSLLPGFTCTDFTVVR